MKKLNLLVIVSCCCALFAGCATPYTPAAEKTTLNQVTQKLGASLNRIQGDGGVTKVRWWRSGYRGASQGGQQITVVDTFYDGEFGADGVLHRWRAVDNSVSLDDSFGFDLQNVAWSSGYLRHDGTFVDDHRQSALRSMGFADYQYRTVSGTLYIGQAFSR